MSENLTLRRPISTWWWVRKRTYFVFVMRELSSLFVAWFVLFLLLLVRAVGNSEAAYEDFLDWAASPVIVVVNVVGFVFIVLHAVTWFSLTPQAHGASGARTSGAGIPDHRRAVRRARGRVRLRLVAGAPMSKRRIEPLVWLTFSGGGVTAAMFLPVLAFLFALAFPLGWITPPSRDHLLGILGNPLTFLVLVGIFPVMLVHAAHRFRYTLYDGLQLKWRWQIALVCYGAAVFGAAAAFLILVTVLLSGW